MNYPEKALVLYKTQPAIILSHSQDKYEIQTETDTKKVRDKDFVLLHRGPVTNLKSVLSYILPETNIQEAIDFFEGEQPSLKEISDLLWTDLPADAWWSLWNTISTNPFFIALSPEKIQLRSKEEAKLLLQKEASKKNETEERDSFIKRLLDSLKTKQCLDLTQDGKFLQEVEALALGKTDKSRLLKDAKIPETQESAHAVLITTGYWYKEYNPWPYRYNHSIRSAKVAVQPPVFEHERLDLTMYESWAIDNEWSQDPDDAILFDGEKLWIHVADPAETVIPDSPADLEARTRGSTLYIPEGASRMLSEESLSYYILGGETFSNALSFCLSLDDSARIIDVSIHRTKIKVSCISYEHALSLKEDTRLAPLFSIAHTRLQSRVQAGAISIELPEVHIQVSKTDLQTMLVSIKKNEPNEATELVREMMLLAGEGAARFAFKHKIPFQYVGQDEPEIPKKLNEGLVGEYQKRKGMKSRKIGTIPQDHAGLGLGMYSQVTSPLRRYGDLVAHQQLHNFLDNKPLMDTESMLRRIAQGDQGARECTLAERKTNLHWILVYLQANPDWSGQAVIVDYFNNQAVILIPELAQESKILLNSKYELGTSITVRAGNIDIPKQQVSFIEVL